MHKHLTMIVTISLTTPATVNVTALVLDIRRYSARTCSLIIKMTLSIPKQWHWTDLHLNIYLKAYHEESKKTT